jgi:hypothetical protein
MDRLTNDRLRALYDQAVQRGTATHGAHVPPERLQDLVTRRGDEAARLADFDHVMSCAVCRSGYELLTSLDAARAPEQRWTRWIPFAAAAAILAAVALSSLRPSRSEDGSAMRDGTPLPTAQAPVGDVAPPDARTFVWRAVPSAIRYDFALLDAVGTPIHTAATADTTYTLPLNIALTPGDTFQWVVSAELPRGQPAVSAVQQFRLR